MRYELLVLKRDWKPERRSFERYEKYGQKQQGMKVMNTRRVNSLIRCPKGVYGFKRKKKLFKLTQHFTAQHPKA